jgi:hypothetical protein
MAAKLPVVVAAAAVRGTRAPPRHPYLIERALTAGEAEALAADYLAQAAELGAAEPQTREPQRLLGFSEWS